MSTSGAIVCLIRQLELSDDIRGLLVRQLVSIIVNTCQCSGVKTYLQYAYKEYGKHNWTKHVAMLDERTWCIYCLNSHPYICIAGAWPVHVYHYARHVKWNMKNECVCKLIPANELSKIQPNIKERLEFINFSACRGGKSCIECGLTLTRLHGEKN